MRSDHLPTSFPDLLLARIAICNLKWLAGSTDVSTNLVVDEHDESTATAEAELFRFDLVTAFQLRIVASSLWPVAFRLVPVT